VQFIYARGRYICVFLEGMRWYVSLYFPGSDGAALCVHDIQQESLRITAQQVAQVCDTLEQAGDTSRLARFLWSLPTDARSTAAFNQFEPVLRARALVAFHGGHFHHLYRILTTYRFARRLRCTRTLPEYCCCLNFTVIVAFCTAKAGDYALSL